MRMKGKIKWFDHQRGFGFVVIDNVGDALLHKDEIESYDQVKDELQPGAIIEFFAIYRMRALNATLVQRAS